MIDGWVYKLYSEDAEDFYIGSTIDFHNRKISHKTDCNNENSKNYNFKVYKFIRDNGGYNNWKFEILELGEYENKYLLHDRERYFIKTLKPTLNIQIPNRTDKEWYEDNIDKIKQYREDNIDKIKQYRENNKEKAKEYGKKYYENNKGKIKEKAKEYGIKYYENNKEKAKEYGKEKKLCEVCNCYIRRDGLSKHKKSQKHIKNLNN